MPETPHRNHTEHFETISLNHPETIPTKPHPRNHNCAPSSRRRLRDPCWPVHPEIFRQDMDPVLFNGDLVGSLPLAERLRHIVDELYGGRQVPRGGLVAGGHGARRGGAPPRGARKMRVEACRADMMAKGKACEPLQRRYRREHRRLPPEKQQRRQPPSGRQAATAIGRRRRRRFTPMCP